MARTVEWNKSRRESRTLLLQEVTSEALAFPFVEQAARLRRQVRGKADEVVGLITSLPRARLDATQWLGGNRLGWHIENGLHLRLDVSLRDDQCRFRKPKSLWVMGMIRRLANSLFLHWRDQHRKPAHKTTTDFQTYIEEDNLRRGLRIVTAAQPTIKPLS